MPRGDPPPGAPPSEGSAAAGWPVGRGGSRGAGRRARAGGILRDRPRASREGLDARRDGLARWPKRALEQAVQWGAYALETVVPCCCGGALVGLLSGAALFAALSWATVPPYQIWYETNFRGRAGGPPDAVFARVNLNHQTWTEHGERDPASPSAAEAAPCGGGALLVPAAGGAHWLPTSYDVHLLLHLRIHPLPGQHSFLARGSLHAPSGRTLAEAAQAFAPLATLSLLQGAAALAARLARQLPVAPAALTLFENIKKDSPILKEASHVCLALEPAAPISEAHVEFRAVDAPPASRAPQLHRPPPLPRFAAWKPSLATFLHTRPRLVFSFLALLGLSLGGPLALGALVACRFFPPAPR